MILSFQVAALVPKCELDQLGVSPKEDFQSRLMTQALRKIHYSLSQSQTLIIFVNQVEAILLDRLYILLFEYLFVRYINEPLDFFIQYSYAG